ncbi:MAG: aldo/keto reductase [Deltaproteobacteria bacterium]|nr:aldo/keto reductase [Deltaproteobacteria bacterium]
MRRITLGDTTVTAIGSGDICLARSAARRVDHGDVARALHATLTAGLDLIDAAPDAEELAARSVRELRLRDRTVIATRIPAISTRDVLSDRLPPRYVVDRVERTLRTTRLDAIPLAQLPVRAFWRTSSAWPELAGTAARLVREGKVLRWGAILDTVEEDTRDLAQEPWLVSLAVPYSLCNAPALLGTRLTLLARQPLAGGALAGTLGPGVALPPDDDRRDIPDAELTRVAREVARLSQWVKRTPPAARSCDPAKQQLEVNPRHPHLEADTLPELALRAVIDRGAVALPRLHRHDMIVPALLAASAPPLPPELLRALFPEEKT